MHVREEGLVPLTGLHLKGSVLSLATHRFHGFTSVNMLSSLIIYLVQAGLFFQAISSSIIILYVVYLLQSQLEQLVKSVEGCTAYTRTSFVLLLC